MLETLLSLGIVDSTRGGHLNGSMQHKRKETPSLEDLFEQYTYNHIYIYM